MAFAFGLCLHYHGHSDHESECKSWSVTFSSSLDSSIENIGLIMTISLQNWRSKTHISLAGLDGVCWSPVELFQLRRLLHTDGSVYEDYFNGYFQSLSRVLDCGDEDLTILNRGIGITSRNSAVANFSIVSLRVWVERSLRISVLFPRECGSTVSSRISVSIPRECVRDLHHTIGTMERVASFLCSPFVRLLRLSPLTQMKQMDSLTVSVCRPFVLGQSHLHNVWQRNAIPIPILNSVWETCFRYINLQSQFKIALCSSIWISDGSSGRLD